jgi:hypothetical protein
MNKLWTVFFFFVFLQVKGALWLALEDGRFRCCCCLLRSLGGGRNWRRTSKLVPAGAGRRLRIQRVALVAQSVECFELGFASRQGDYVLADCNTEVLVVTVLSSFDEFFDFGVNASGSRWLSSSRVLFKAQLFD